MLSWARRRLALLWDSLLLPGPMLPAELIVGLSTLTAGLVLLWPAATYDTAKSYDAVRHIPEPTLGAWLAAVGVVVVAGVLASGSPRQRQRVLLVEFATWLFLAAGFVVANPISIATPLMAAHSFLGAFSYIRAGVTVGR